MKKSRAFLWVISVPFLPVFVGVFPALFAVAFFFGCHYICGDGYSWAEIGRRVQVLPQGRLKAHQCEVVLLLQQPALFSTILDFSRPVAGVARRTTTPEEAFSPPGKTPCVFHRQAAARSCRSSGCVSFRYPSCLSCTLSSELDVFCLPFPCCHQISIFSGGKRRVYQA